MINERSIFKPTEIQILNVQAAAKATMCVGVCKFSQTDFN